MKLPLQKLSKVGAGCVIAGLILGAGGTLWAMIQSFQRMEREGITDPQQLSSGMDTTFYLATAGLGLGFIGLLMLGTAFLMKRAQKSSDSEPS